jgi:hypothetical protein
MLAKVVDLLLSNFEIRQQTAQSLRIQGYAMFGTFCLNKITPGSRPVLCPTANIVCPPPIAGDRHQRSAGHFVATCAGSRILRKTQKRLQILL